MKETDYMKEQRIFGSGQCVDKLEAMRIAINKFLFFSWNFSMTVVKDFAGGTSQLVSVPKFVADVPWTFGLHHAVNKWQEVVKNHTDPYSYVPAFYATLDSTNRRLFLDYVIEFYNDKQRL